MQNPLLLLTLHESRGNITNQPTGPRMHLHRRTSSDASSITDDCENKPTTQSDVQPPPCCWFWSSKSSPPSPQSQTRKLLCSCPAPLLSCETCPFQQESWSSRVVLFTHRCWYPLGINPILLMNTASTKLWRLCTAKCMTVGHNLCHLLRCKKILNLKSKMRGACTCKTWFLRFSQSN